MSAAPPRAHGVRRARLSLRTQLLAGILLPIVLFIGFNTVALHRQALASLHTAYDRTLLASAKTISEQLDVTGYGAQARLRATVPYAALEAFEADNQSRMFYRVSALDGTLVSGYAELPAWTGTIPAKPPYAALVDFYDAQFRGQPVRVAVLLQPVSTPTGRGMAVIQVAETLELRQTQALDILRHTLLRQGVLMAVIALTVWAVVQRATRPVRQLSHTLRARAEGDLSAITTAAAPRELESLVEATNQVMQRLRHLLLNQKRFVRDAAHQLRTPLAVLKTQVQSAQRRDLPPEQALREIGGTVERAIQLANQMLALAKVEQLRQQSTPEPAAFDALLREVALELSPLIAQHDLDFSIHTEPAAVRADAWMLRELARNLLHNAIAHGRAGGTLSVQLVRAGGQAVLTVADSGPGIPDALAARLYTPFSAGDPRTGSGLGLAICQDIVQALGGSLTLQNRRGAGGAVLGLDAVARLPESA